MNIIDKIISYFNPQAAFERAQYHNALMTIGTPYDTATPTPHFDPVSYQFTADDDIKELDTLRATARHNYNNNGFYSGIIEAALDHVVGSGIRAKSTIKKSLTPGISDERRLAIEKMFDDYFNSWAESTIGDVTAKDDFYTLQRLAYANYKIDGDCFAALPLRSIGAVKVLQVNIIDAALICSTNVDFIEGIKLSNDKMPLKYSIKQSDGSYREVSAFSSGKRNVLHTFRRKRAGQVRGIPFLNAVTRDAKYIDDLMRYELTAAKLASIFFGSITTQAKNSAFGDTDNNLLGKPGEQAQTTKNTVKENTITQLRPGDELKIHTSGRDTANFDKFVSTSLKKLSTHTRIPLEIILAQFVSSYSASRAAMLQMMKFVKPERKLFINSFCKPTRDQVITYGILSGQLVVPEFYTYRSALLGAMWIGEPMGSVDPGKDVRAHREAVDARFETFEQAVEALGFGDFEQNAQVLETELSTVNKLNAIMGIEN